MALMTKLGPVYTSPPTKISGCAVWYVAKEAYGDDAAMKDYPFQLIGHHTKSRTHSSYGNVAWLESVHPQQLWINAGGTSYGGR